MKELPMTKKTKELLQEVSALFGVRSDIVKQIWDYTIITLFLKMTENPEGEHILQLPMIGELIVKYKNSVYVKNGTITEVESNLRLDEEFKNLIGDVYFQGNSPIIEFVQDNLIKNTIENALE